MPASSEPAHRVVHSGCMQCAIKEVSREELPALIDRLIAMTCDAVDAGASLGWSSPMDPAEARAYWESRAAALDGGGTHLLAATIGGELAGCVQLERGHFPQSRHRGEVAKLMVRTAFRRQGIARRLMENLEDLARITGMTTLMLDTRPGEPVEHLYRDMRYERTGHIPRAIRGPHGDMQDTVFYYKLL